MEGTDTRARIIRIFTFLGGVYFFLYFVIPEELLKRIGVGTGFDFQVGHEKISNGFIVIGAMALGLGLINLLASHGSRLAFRRPGWVNSLALLVGMFAMILTASSAWISGLTVSKEVRDVQLLGEFASLLVEKKGADSTLPQPERITALVSAARERSAKLASHFGEDKDTRAAMVRLRDEAGASLNTFNGSIEQLAQLAPYQAGDALDAALGAVATSASQLGGSYGAYRRAHQDETVTKRMYDFLFKGLFIPLGSAMFALLGVYIAAAAYRAFKVRTLESGLMMTAAVIVMLGQISFGTMLWDDLPAIRQWLLEKPSGAAFRAIRIGASVAGLMLAIRMWLSIESKSFSKGEE